jgi:hypothetical protein
MISTTAQITEITFDDAMDNMQLAVEGLRFFLLQFKTPQARSMSNGIYTAFALLELSRRSTTTRNNSTSE